KQNEKKKTPPPTSQEDDDEINKKRVDRARHGEQLQETLNNNQAAIQEADKLRADAMKAYRPK
ncbi:MAG: hypothetical protein QGH40_00425, partial [bacterium]|nr:hypothetical protein [bacterium]